MRGQPTLLFLVAVLSLIGIGLVVGNDFYQSYIKDFSVSKKVLGTGTADVKNLVNDTFQSTKEVVVQKAAEAQKTVVADFEKEAASLTKAQVDALKVQICRDWGVISPVPSFTPTP